MGDMAENPLITLSPVDWFQMKEAFRLLFLFKKPLDVVRMKAALVALQGAIPEIGGRLIKEGGNYCIDTNNPAVPFEVVDVDTDIPDYGPQNAWVDEAAYTNAVDPLHSPDAEASLCRIKLSRFKGGACILGVTFSHCLTDAVGGMGLVAQWAALCRGDKTVGVDRNRDKLVALAEHTKNKADSDAVFVELDHQLLSRFKQIMAEVEKNKAYNVYTVSAEKLGRIIEEKTEFSARSGKRA